MKCTKLALITVVTYTIAGCTSHTPTSPDKPTPAMVQAAVASTQQKIRDVQNDPSIPESTKSTIIARLKGNMDRTIQANQTALSPVSSK
jgi:hypothetical protein